MRKNEKASLTPVVSRFFIFTVIILLIANSGYALDISIEPANAQREVGGKLRVHVYVIDAVDLISMGVKVSFDSPVLRVSSASKNEDFSSGWVLDADNDPGTTNDQYTTPPIEIVNDDGLGQGHVTMIGGRLTGLTGAKVLLGWIVFDIIEEGNTNLTVDVAKRHPNHPTDTFDNFVGYDSSTQVPIVYDSSIPGPLPAQRAVAYAVINACEANLNIPPDAYVNRVDVAIFSPHFGTSFMDPNYNPAADFDGDGDVDRVDVAILSADFGRSDCPQP